MYLLNSWRNSLQLLKRSNCKLFFLVTLKALWPTYKVLIKYWAWLWLFLYSGIWHAVYASIISYVSSASIVDVSAVEYATLGFEITLRYLFIFAVCLSARPSVLQKNCAYFRGYWKHFIAFLILLIIFGGAIMGLLKITSQFFKYNSIATKLTLLPLACMIEVMLRGGFAIAGIAFVFGILFILDCPRSTFCLFSATKGTILMIWYNLPMCLLLIAIFNGIYFGLYELFSMFGLVGTCGIDVFSICLNLLQPIPIIVYTNVYIKWVHEQSRLYYWQPS